MVAVLVVAGCSSSPGWGFEMRDMDQTVRPGDDFFDHAVGAWVDRVEVPPDSTCVGVNADIDGQLLSDVDEIVREAADEDAPHGNPAQQMGDLYRSYVDEETLDARGDDPIRPYLSAIDTIAGRADLDATLVDFAQRGTLIADPFVMSIWVDAKQPSRFLPRMSQGGLSLGDRDYYLDSEYADLRDRFVDHVARTLKLAGYADADVQARRVLALETELADVQWPYEETLDVEKISTVMRRADVEKLGAGAPLAALFDANGFPAATDFVVETPDVLEATARIYADEPVEDWRAYLRYQVLLAYGQYLSTPFADEMFDFHDRVMYGTEEQAPREDHAAAFVSAQVPDLVGRYYVDGHFRPDTRAKATALAENVTAAYADMIEGATWMSEPTKAEARAKLDSLLLKVGYPETWESYPGLDIRPDDLVGNTERANRVWWRSWLDRLGEPADRADWAGSTVQENNASYFPQFNDVVLPAGILQPPFFHPDADAAANYGAIGSTIGHEITHAFDSQGRKSDSTGALRDWWAPADAERYEQQAEALVVQYDGYEPIDGEHIDGVLTLAENIADLAGLEVAYDAYRRSLQGREAPVIDGLTGDQRFFLAYAGNWRDLCREEYALDALQTDDHSPAKFRVNGVVRNMDEWYDAFDVKEGDALYLAPEDRVRIW